MPSQRSGSPEGGSVGGGSAGQEGGRGAEGASDDAVSQASKTSKKASQVCCTCVFAWVGGWLGARARLRACFHIHLYIYVSEHACIQVSFRRGWKAKREELECVTSEIDSSFAFVDVRLHSLVDTTEQHLARGRGVAVGAKHHVTAQPRYRGTDGNGHNARTLASGTCSPSSLFVSPVRGNRASLASGV